MGGSFIKVEGLDKALARFDVKKYEPQIQQCFDRFGLSVELKAKQLAPVDEGHLKGSIFQQPGRLSSTVGASVNYAAYLEFGTRQYAAAYVGGLPAQWQELAQSKKGGTSGTFEQFVLRLTAWVHRKGITGIFSVKTRKRIGTKDIQEKQDMQAAYLIARKILKNGIKPQPFLYPAFNISKEKLLKELNAIKL